MSERRKRVPVMETSKKILLFCDIVVVLTVTATFIVAILEIDVTALAEITVALIGLAGAAHSFYYWKAKAENMSKYKRRDGITMEENQWNSG